MGGTCFGRVSLAKEPGFRETDRFRLVPGCTVVASLYLVVRYEPCRIRMSVAVPWWVPECFSFLRFSVLAYGVGAFDITGHLLITGPFHTVREKIRS